MKQTLLHLALLALLQLVPTAAMGYDFMVDGIFYNVKNGQAIVTKPGTASAGAGIPGGYSGEVVIPSEVAHDSITYPVTAIGAHAFSGCAGLTSISMPGSITTIGQQAFNGCSGLSSVTIPHSVSTIEEWAFMGCSHLLSVTFGRGVKTIGHSILDGCSRVTSVTCLAATPPVVDNYGLFNNYTMYYHAKLHVMEGYEADYLAAPVWSDFFQIIGDIPVPVPEDVNGDGEINIADANNVIEVIVHGPGSGGHSRLPSGESLLDVADVNSDGEINIADINAILDAIINQHKL